MKWKRRPTSALRRWAWASRSGCTQQPGESPSGTSCLPPFRCFVAGCFLLPAPGCSVTLNASPPRRASLASLAPFELIAPEDPADGAQALADIGCLAQGLRVCGRAVHLPGLIENHLCALLRASVDHAIAIFEAGPLTGILDLHVALDASREAHRLLGIAACDFDDIVDSADWDGAGGRIALHASAEVVFDVLPNWDADLARGVFLPSSRSTQSRMPERKRCPKASAFLLFGGSDNLVDAARVVNQAARLYFGLEHQRALLAVLGDGRMRTLVNDVAENAMGVFSSCISPFLERLRIAYAPIKLPSLDYGPSGELLSEHCRARKGRVSKCQSVVPGRLQVWGSVACVLSRRAWVACELPRTARQTWRSSQ
eukprot:Opistho-1_new@26315